MTRERVEQADVVVVVEQDKEALRGDSKKLMVKELREVHLDELAGEGVEEATAVWSS